MTIVQYLLSEDCPVNHSAIAKLMWPHNKNAKSYFSRKLNEKDNRQWTEDDTELARKALNKLAVDITKLK